MADEDRKQVAYTDCTLTQESGIDGVVWNVKLVGKNQRDEEIKVREFQLSDSELVALLASGRIQEG